MKIHRYQTKIKYSQKPWRIVNPDKKILGYYNDIYPNLFRLAVFVLISAEESEGYKYFKSESAMFWCDVINQNPDYFYKKIKLYRIQVNEKKRNNKNRIL